MNHPALALFVLLSTACGPPPALDERAAPEGVFARTAGPALEHHCGAPPCHGNEARPLRVYAPGTLRADPSRVHRDEPLSADEVRANERRAQAFLSEAPSALDALVLAKPLGRVAHLGGVLCDGPTDTPCAELLAWAHAAGLR